MSTLSSYFRLSILRNVTPNCLSGTRCPTPLASSFLGPYPSLLESHCTLCEAYRRHPIPGEPCHTWDEYSQNSTQYYWSLVGLHAITFEKPGLSTQLHTVDACTPAPPLAVPHNCLHSHDCFVSNVHQLRL